MESRRRPAFVQSGAQNSESGKTSCPSYVDLAQFLLLILFFLCYSQPVSGPI